MSKKISKEKSERTTNTSHIWLLILPFWIGFACFLIFLLIKNMGTIPLQVGMAILVAVLGFLGGVFFYRESNYIFSLKLRSQQFQSFCGAIRKAAQTLELQEILDSSARIIVEVTGVRGCTIKLLDTKTKKMKVRSIIGLEDEKTGEAIAIAESMYHKGLMHGKPIFVRDVFLRDYPAVDEEIESLLCVPLRYEEKVLGAICIFGEKGQKLSPEMISLLSSLADIIALSISHANLYENLKNLVETKTAFMRQTSHELRSPLTAISSMAKTLAQGYAGELNPQQKDMVERISVRSHMLSEIVGDLLSLAKGRAQASMLSFEDIDVKRILQDVVSFLEARAQDKNVTINTNIPENEVVLKSNEEGLRTIMMNLIDNAIKYTPHNGEVMVKLGEQERCVIFQVSDSGIGIPEREKENLFTEFFRASNAKTVSEKGTGLGLTIVKTTTEQLGGEIGVDSTEGEGTTFTVTFKKSVEHGSE
jgi:signal transduction histidine kinase